MEKPIDPHLRFTIRGYCLEELLGYGKVTSLYRARTEELWQMPEVIMTLLHVPETFSMQARRRFLERFLHEASKIVQLRHSSLFPVFGYGEEDGLPYLVIPDVTGVSLASHLKQKKRWSPSEILMILEPIAAALSYIHNQGLVYQFFNPTNVLFQKDAPPQITSLNLAQILCLGGLEEESINTSSFEHLKNIAGGYLGAPEYLAPEVVKGAKPDARSDVYSLGVILFEMLSGKTPFTGQNYVEIAQKHVREILPSLHEIAPDLPVALELVVNRALHRNLGYRFQTPSELIAAYSHVLEERIYGVNHVPLLPAGEQIRALLAAPRNTVLVSSTNDQQTESTEKRWQTSNGRTIPPLIGLPSSLQKNTRPTIGTPPAPNQGEKPLRSSRGFMTNEAKANPKPLVSSPERAPQPNVDQKPVVSPARNTDIAAMAHELHLMMRKLQASLSK